VVQVVQVAVADLVLLEFQLVAALVEEAAVVLRVVGLTLVVVAVA
jgi:hypothetical protein